MTTNTPGNYSSLSGGNKTYRFFGPGVYTFSSIAFNNANTIIFDFNGQPGKIVIRVLNTMNLDKIAVSYLGLPAGSTNANAARRIYTEVLNAANAAGDVFMIANGSSTTETRWLGTVYANGGIRIGSGTSGATNVNGAFWAKTTVTLNSGANAIYTPLVDCSQSAVSIVAVNDIAITPASPTGDIPCDKQEVTITSSTNISNPTYQWTSSTGYVVQNGTTATPTITTSGTYTVVVSNLDGCTATAQVSVTACLDRLQNFNKTDNQVTDGVLSGVIKGNTFKTEPGENPIVVTIGDKTLIDVILNKNNISTALSTLRGLTGNGFQEIAYYQSTVEQKQIVTCLFNTADLNIFNTNATYISLFDYIRPAYLPNNQVGAINSEGDAAIKTNLVRDAYNVDGKGVRLAVISDSYDNNGGADNDILRQDLPGLVITADNPSGTIDRSKTVIVADGRDFPKDIFGARSDEGRAMLQITHDVAPGATLLFRTGFISESDMAEGIRRLARPLNASDPNAPTAGYGSDIIVDDVSYLTSPFFTDGIISKAINDVTANYGTKYFTSAGNYGKKSYEGLFTRSMLPMHALHIDSVLMLLPDNQTVCRKFH